jgi:hypothetical protein
MVKPPPAGERPVVLQLRARSANPVTLEAALRLAAALHRDFESIFIEDDDLLSLSAMPFAREITMSGRRSRPLSQAAVERQMHASSMAARRQIEAIARRLDVKTSFTTVRDKPGHAMRQAGERAAILVFGEPISAATHREMRAVVSCLSGVAGCLLVGQGVRRAEGRVIALIDDPSRMKEIVEAALQFGDKSADELAVLAVPEVLSRPDEFAIELSAIVGRERRVLVEPLASGEPAALSHGVNRLGGGLLVAGFGGRLIGSDVEIARVAAALECPLLLLRPGALEPAAA